MRFLLLCSSSSDNTGWKEKKKITIIVNDFWLLG